MLAANAVRAIDDIAGLPHAEGFSGADISAAISTAQLRAVETAVQANRLASSAGRPADARPIISLEHLRSAVMSTRASVGQKDRSFYHSIYSRFQGLDKKEGEDGARTGERAKHDGVASHINDDVAQQRTMLA